MALGRRNCGWRVSLNPRCLIPRMSILSSAVFVELANCGNTIQSGLMIFSPLRLETLRARCGGSVPIKILVMHGRCLGEVFGAGLSVQLPVPLGQPIKKNSRRYVSTPIPFKNTCRRQVGGERIAEGINPIGWIDLHIAPVLLEVVGHLA